MMNNGELGAQAKTQRKCFEQYWGAVLAEQLGQKQHQCKGLGSAVCLIFNLSVSKPVEPMKQRMSEGGEGSMSAFKNGRNWAVLSRTMTNGLRQERQLQ